jgi:energy-coupling factor transporter ATP-binding protein EcfA2
MVEHDLDLLAQVSERIYAMVNGRLVFEGTRGEFTASEVNRTLRGLGLGEAGGGDWEGASTPDLQGDRAT